MGRHTCCQKQKLKKGLWSPEEDEKLISFITRHGHGCWSSLPKQAGLQRCGKSCRLRWINYLRPDLKRGMFSPSEEKLIFDLHDILGNRWAQIASHLPGRTDNEIKNHWNSCLKKRLNLKGQTQGPKLDESTEMVITNMSTFNNQSTSLVLYEDEPNGFHHSSRKDIYSRLQANANCFKLKSAPQDDTLIFVEAFDSSGTQVPQNWNDVIFVKEDYFHSPPTTLTRSTNIDKPFNLPIFSTNIISTTGENLQLPKTKTKHSYTIDPLYHRHISDLNDSFKSKEELEVMHTTPLDANLMMESAFSHCTMEDDANERFLNTTLPNWSETLYTHFVPLIDKESKTTIYDYDLHDVKVNHDCVFDFEKPPLYRGGVDSNLATMAENLLHKSSFVYIS